MPAARHLKYPSIPAPYKLPSKKQKELVIIKNTIEDDSVTPINLGKATPFLKIFPNKKITIRLA